MTKNEHFVDFSIISSHRNVWKDTLAFYYETKAHMFISENVAIDLLGDKIQRVKYKGE